MSPGSISTLLGVIGSGLTSDVADGCVTDFELDVFFTARAFRFRLDLTVCDSLLLVHSYRLSAGATANDAAEKVKARAKQQISFISFLLFRYASIIELCFKRGNCS